MAVKVGDKCYAYSANADIKAKGEYGGVVTTIMKYPLSATTMLNRFLLLKMEKAIWQS